MPYRLVRLHQKLGSSQPGSPIVIQPGKGRTRRNPGPKAKVWPPTQEVELLDSLPLEIPQDKSQKQFLDPTPSHSLISSLRQGLDPIPHSNPPPGKSAPLALRQARHTQLTEASTAQLCHAASHLEGQPLHQLNDTLLAMAGRRPVVPRY